jgi:hypothetical protein
LALAAEQSGVTLFLLRLEAQPVPSARTRAGWSAAAPSQSLEAGAPWPAHV